MQCASHGKSNLVTCLLRLNAEGSKESFQWLNQNNKPTYHAFEIALKPNANIEDIKRLVWHVIKT